MEPQRRQPGELNLASRSSAALRREEMMDCRSPRPAQDHFIHRSASGETAIFICTADIRQLIDARSSTFISAEYGINRPPVRREYQLASNLNHNVGTA
ncbi:hypothetical protein KCP73_07465 [Salmonella enterica subsp. enterica]|nr:hypothetical protein KCP73_07465 [Salmonella enterica subsp. enterica]